MMMCGHDKSIRTAHLQTVGQTGKPSRSSSLRHIFVAFGFFLDMLGVSSDDFLVVLSDNCSEIVVLPLSGGDTSLHHEARGKPYPY